MKEDKIKEAFKRVKEDMLILTKQFEELTNKQNTTQKKETPQKKDDFERLKTENFIKNAEEEFGTLNLHVNEFDDKIKHLNSQINNIILEHKIFSKKILENRNTAQNNKLDLDIVDEKFQELSDILSEKINLEIGSLKLEYTEEIAKLYDKFFTEILDLKTEINKKLKNKEMEDKKIVVENKSQKKDNQNKGKDKKEQKGIDKEKNTQSEELYPEPKTGKLKKIAKWLFVDEETDEFENIKEQIKEDSSKDKKSKKEK